LKRPVISFLLGNSILRIPRYSERGHIEALGNRRGRDSLRREYDFAVNYQSGLFQVLAGGAISAGGTVYITYKYGLPTKVCVGELVAYEGGLAFVNMYKQSLRAVNGLPLAGN